MTTDRQVAVVWVVCLVALAAGSASCADAGKVAANLPDAGKPDGGITALGPFSKITTGPLYLHTIGLLDRFNFYDSTVFLYGVEVPDGPRYRSCSGVLVASNLALTAAHCLCAPTHGQATRFDGSNCAAKANLRIRTPVPPVDSDNSWMELERTGSVVIHPQFEIVLDTKGAVVTSRADLALVHMDEPIPSDVPIAPARFATQDVRTGDVLIVVGYAMYEDGDLSHRLRESSQELVELPAGDDRYFFGFEKDASFKGDTGGPCLRQTKCGQELVGISQRGLGPKSALTRIAPYRKWLDEQIRLAGGKN